MTPPEAPAAPLPSGRRWRTGRAGSAASAWFRSWVWVLALFAAQAATAEGFGLRGTTLDGRAFDIASLRGKVVLVFFWSTDCAVCLSKLPELRLNAEGWRERPFEMVLVNVDRQRSDVAGYESARAAVSPRGTRPHPALWRGEAGYADTLPSAPGRLPLSLLIDTRGAVAERFEGRIPADAWDRIAELLP